MGYHKLMVDDSKKVKIAPKSRIRKKTTPQPCTGGGSHVYDDDILVAGAMVGSNIQAETEEVVYEKIYNKDNDYHSRSRKRMRCVGTQADEEANDYNDPQRRKKMPPLELAEDHNNRQQSTAITDDDGNGLLTLVQEEPATTNFGFDFDFEVDQFLNPIMWPASEGDQFILPLEEEERRLHEEANQALSCTVVPN